MLSKDRCDKGLWWDKAWSLVEGCTPVSEACDHCWLAQLTSRFGDGQLLEIPGGTAPRFHGDIRIREDRLLVPLKTRKPTVWAIWSDLFHEAVPFKFACTALNVMEACSLQEKAHIFLALTKRPERMSTIVNEWIEEHVVDNISVRLDNIWFGTTVENQRTAAERIPHLLKVPGKRFLSIEPLLGPVNLRNIDAEKAGHQDMFFVDSLTGKHDDMGRPCEDVGKIHAVIVGSESGPGARPAKIEWIESIVEQCRNAGVPCFVKQVHINGKLNKRPEEWPESIRVRQLPWAKELSA